MSSVARTSFYNFSANVVRVVLSFLTTVLLARGLGATSFGEVNLIIGYTTCFHYLWAMGFDHTLAYYLPGFQVDERPWLAREALKVALLTSTAISVGFIALGALIFPGILTTRGLGHFVLPGLILGGQNWISAMGAILSGYLRGAKNFTGLIVKDQLIFPGTHLLLSAVAIFFLHGGILAYAGVFAASNAIALLYGLWRVGRIVPARDIRERRRTHRTRRAWVGYSIPVALTGAIECLLPWGTIIALGWYVPASTVGQFAVCYRVSVFIQFLLLAVGPIFSPYLAEHLQKKEMKRFQELYHSVNFLCGAWSLILAAVFFLSSDVILKLFGREFSGSTMLLGALLLANLLEGAFGAIKQSLIMSGKSQVNLVNVSIATVVNLVACIVLIPRFGAMGGAWANLVSYLVINILRMFEFYWSFAIGPFNRTQSLILASVAVGLGALCVWSHGGGVSVAVRIGVSVAIIAASTTIALRTLQRPRLSIKVTY